jgi:N-acetylglutamate synthase-like GNAT family acetyltransferase/DNA-binding MarR family transcriptional regulator
MSVPDSAGERLREVARLFLKSQRTRSACCDGTSTVQCHVLNELLRRGAMSQRALADALGLDKGWISRAVDALVRDGSLDKTPDAQDRRSVVLRLSGAGEQRAHALSAQLDRHAQTVLDGIAPQRHDEVARVLGWLLQALQGEAIPAGGPLGAPRAARTDDWPAIAALLRANGLPLAGARTHLADFLVIDAGDHIVAAAGRESHGPVALLRSVVTAADWRGHGLAERLLAGQRQDAAAAGADTLFLLTTTAESYFARRGFVRCPRAAVPPALHASAEFQGACPASAIVMRTAATRREPA